MKLVLRGTRGSIASAGSDTVVYGGDTSCIELRTADDRMLILDAGSGIRALGKEAETMGRVDILLTHLHMDHIQGLPFFGPMLNPQIEVHVWGPISTTETLRERIGHYLSPPLFPVLVRDLANVWFHDVTPGNFDLDSLKISADLICHPGSTLGYRIEEDGAVVAYMPDHEPALGKGIDIAAPEWTSGYGIAAGADLLIHDSQYTDAEYEQRVGWGHTASSHLVAFATMAGVTKLATFHHDPAHTDEMLDEIHADLAARANGFELIPGKAGSTLEL